MADRSPELPLTSASRSIWGGAGISDYIALLKPRVMSLVVFTAFAGLFLAPGNLHPLIAACAVVCIALGAGASGAINMWYDRDIDAAMTRTANRPIPAGRLNSDSALRFGIVLALGSVVIMGLFVNWLSAGLLALTIAFYVFVYTIWLKRRTPQNIVIGGAAGAFPPIVGWAAVTGDITWSPIILFAIIFMWTPPHFWALALYRKGDYEKAGVPMMPVVAGPKKTKQQILFYTILLAPLGVCPTIFGMASWSYGILAGLLGLIFVCLATAIFCDKGEFYARKTFAFSILYLFLLFAGLIADHAVKLAG